MSYIISVRMGIFITLSKRASYRMWYHHLLNTWRLCEGRVYSVFSELAAHERRHNKDVLAQEICVVKTTTKEVKVPTPLVPIILFTAKGRALLQCSLQLWPFSSPCQQNTQLWNSLDSWKCMYKRLDFPIATFHINHFITNTCHSVLTRDKIPISNPGLVSTLQCFMTSSFETPTGTLWYCRNGLFLYWFWNTVVLNAGIKKGFSTFIGEVQWFCWIIREGSIVRFEVTWFFKQLHFIVKIFTGCS